MSNVPAARPKIVCLCGSLRFSREFATERMRLTLDLAIVLAPEATEAQLDPSLSRALGELHLRRIDLADEVRIVNPGGYIGEATRREVAYAKASGKPITYFHNPPPGDVAMAMFVRCLLARSLRLRRVRGRSAT